MQSSMGISERETRAASVILRAWRCFGQFRPSHKIAEAYVKRGATGARVLNIG